ncbi:tonB-system energizer ExbB [Vibrio sp. vnigr-6D03]|nr:tonB-system energizer ExbB [Vibrio sp. vnigr-6D03]
MSKSLYLSMIITLFLFMPSLAFAEKAPAQDLASPLVSDTQLTPPTNPLNAHDLSPMGMYHAADWVVKAVMISLVIASVLTWGVLFAKQWQLSLASKKAHRQLHALTQSDDLIEAETLCEDLQGPAQLLLSATQHELKLSAQGSASEDGIKERVQLRLERVGVSMSSNMTKGTGILATVGSVGPFVGLFGTVWGIMNAFIGIAKSQSTTLAVVAPGIAEALMATAIGLVAAIPAVIFYNHFARQIGCYKNQLADLSVAIMILVSRDLDRRTIQTEQPDAKIPLKEAV